MSISLYLSSTMGTSPWLTGDFYVPLKEKNKQHQPHLIILTKKKTSPDHIRIFMAVGGLREGGVAGTMEGGFGWLVV